MLGAALAFAASVPATKVLVADIPPLALTAAFGLTAGLFSLLLVGLSRARAGRTATGAHGDLARADWPWLAGGVATGSVLAPVSLFAGLERISAHTAGLLLNFEVVFTAGLGVLLAGERLHRRGWLGGALIWAGALLLALPGADPAAPGAVPWAGAALVLAACAMWGLDVNLMLRVSGRDARQIVAVKGLAGGAICLSLALLLGQTGAWTALRALAAAAVGILAYALPLALFVRGLRVLGAVQSGMLFALAPGMATVLAWIFLREPASWAGLAALAIMTAGALLLATDPRSRPRSPSCGQAAPGA